MRTVILAMLVGVGCSLGALANPPAPCDLEILKAEALLQHVYDPGKRRIIEALLDEARRALTLREADRCMQDVAKAEHALRMR